MTRLRQHGGASTDKRGIVIGCHKVYELYDKTITERIDERLTDFGVTVNLAGRLSEYDVWVGCVSEMSCNIKSVISKVMKVRTVPADCPPGCKTTEHTFVSYHFSVLGPG